MYCTYVGIIGSCVAMHSVFGNQLEMSTLEDSAEFFKLLLYATLCATVRTGTLLLIL